MGALGTVVFTSTSGGFSAADVRAMMEVDGVVRVESLDPAEGGGCRVVVAHVERDVRDAYAAAISARFGRALAWIL